MIEFTILNAGDSRLGLYNSKHLSGNNIVLGNIISKVEFSGGLFVQGDISENVDMSGNFINTFLYVSGDIDREANVTVADGLTCKGMVGNGVKLHISCGYVHLNQYKDTIKLTSHDCLYGENNVPKTDSRRYKNEPYPYFFLREPDVTPLSNKDENIHLDENALKKFLLDKINSNQLVKADNLFDKAITLSMFDILPLFNVHKKNHDLNTLKFLGAAIEFCKGKDRILQLERFNALALSNPPYADAVAALKFVVVKKAATVAPTVSPALPAALGRNTQRHQTSQPVSSKKINVATLLEYVEIKITTPFKIDAKALLSPDLKIDACEVLLEYKGKYPDISESDLIFMGAAIEYKKMKDWPKQVGRFKKAADMSPPSYFAMTAYALAKYESYFQNEDPRDLKEATQYFEMAKDKTTTARVKYDEIKINLASSQPQAQSASSSSSETSKALTLPMYTLNSLILDEKPLGNGSSAVVYRAVDRRFDSSVYAVKVFNQGAPEKNIIREAGHMLNIQHPLIVRIYGGLLAADNVTLCGFVMEFMAGGTLFDLLHPKQGKCEADLLAKFKMGIELATALAWLHSRDFLHRDLKSPNVMVSDDGTLKLTDFGISKDESKHNTTTKNMEGTLEWMAPELFNNKPRTSKSDVYALAIMLWEVDTGTIPYKDETMAGITKKKVMHEQLPIDQTSSFADLITNGLDHDPRKRNEAVTFMKVLIAMRAQYAAKAQSRPAPYHTSAAFFK